MKMKRLLAYVLICSIIASYFVQASAATPVLPATGAYESDIYRNLFAETGKTDTEIQAKVDGAFKQLFYGSDSDQRVYYPVGTDMAYIKDVANSDVRSEGMSYGMMICVQLNKQEEFNRLWKWARTYMYQSSGDKKGFFAWQCSTSGSVMDATPASDGDEYFLMSLLFAANRWGNGTGIFNYKQEALNLLDTMLHESDDGSGYNLFNKTQNLVVFCPTAGNYDFTDPSYHLPAFYELWALWADKDNSTWSTIAAASRQYFKKATNSTTGLAPDYSNFDGTPKEVSWSSGHGDFRYDAWRVASNIAVDYAWWKKDSWDNTFADRIQTFFNNQGLTSYGNQFNINGTKLSSDHSPGLVAMNAVASLAATNSLAYDFVNELWKISIPSGQYRYYDGMLYMLGLLHCSGNFKIWKPNGSSPSPSSSPVNTPTPTRIISTGSGDLNNDGVVNMADVILLAVVFNSVRGDSKYIAAYDLNNDGAINMADVIVIAGNFNKIVTVISPTLAPTSTATKAPSPTSTSTPTKVPSPTATPTPTINPNAKLVALTFDDGPDVTLTPKVLDRLEKYNVPATFMQIGQKINDSTKSVENRIITDGCEIGNHSWGYSSMDTMSATDIKKSIDDTNSIIQKYTNTKPKFFRPPNLATSSTMFSAIDLTFVSGVTANDWVQTTTAQQRADAIINGVKDGSIILLHDVQPLPHPTPEALDIIIPTLKSKGYEFVTLSELFRRKGVTLSSTDNKLYVSVP
ncbi:MAG: glycosyl hydrolase family 8 [Bacillota bacterium]|nr:glycosyl hydrolase family 8 [Bacillota bacterium]